MAIHLVVQRPFGGWAKGDVIDDPAAIASVLDGESVASVVKIMADDPPPAPEPAHAPEET